MPYQGLGQVLVYKDEFGQKKGWKGNTKAKVDVEKFDEIKKLFHH